MRVQMPLEFAKGHLHTIALIAMHIDQLNTEGKTNERNHLSSSYTIHGRR